MARKNKVSRQRNPGGITKGTHMDMNNLLHLATADSPNFLLPKLPDLSADWWQRNVLGSPELPATANRARTRTSHAATARLCGAPASPRSELVRAV